MNPYRLAWRVANHRPRIFWVGWVVWALVHLLPIATGWTLSKAFSALDRDRGIDTGAAYRWVLAMVACEIVRMAMIHVGVLVYHRSWVHQQTILRANMLDAQLASGGPHAGVPVPSAGGAVTHFRDDTDDIVMFTDNLVDASGSVFFLVAAGFMLGTADVRAAAMLVAPFGLVVAGTAIAGARLKRLRAADRAAAATVTGMVGDVMSSATTVKVNRAEAAVLARLRAMVDRRRHTAVRDHVLDQGIMAFSQGATDIGLGLVLIVAAGSLASGEFGVGLLALFVSYLGRLDWVPRIAGRVLASSRQSTVAIGRMAGLVHAGDPAELVRHQVLPIGTHERRVRPPMVRPERVPLERLDVVGLSAEFPGSGSGVHDVSFSIGRGEFVVITGEVGSGKTTLLRAVLGLAWNTDQAGEVRWNGTSLGDRAAFLIPPNAAFLPQVPQLLSDTLADNVGFGDTDAGAAQRLEWALGLAELGADVAGFPAGTATTIGPRGLRLSGGQRQRLAAARAVYHRPELVVLDDLSSALDVETELRLWEHFAAAGMTVLAVSHRAVAFDAATRVLRLDAGRLADAVVSRR